MPDYFNTFNLTCDAPRPWGVYFQDAASPQMEALVELHDNIVFYLVIILFAVAWILFSIIRTYVRNKISNKYLSHGTLIELIWTITPALILILIAFPFKLLYLMDEATDPSLNVSVEGHQWYWSYEYPDFLSDNEELEFGLFLDLEQRGFILFADSSKSGSVAGPSSGALPDKPNSDNYGEGPSVRKPTPKSVSEPESSTKASSEDNDSKPATDSLSDELDNLYVGKGKQRAK